MYVYYILFMNHAHSTFYLSWLKTYRYLQQFFIKVDTYIYIKFVHCTKLI